MIIVGFIIICMLSVRVEGRHYAQYYNEHKFHLWNYNQTSSPIDRIITAIRSYLETGIIRIQEIKQIRWLYEESAPYETGYLIGDIVERYKKLVEAVRRAHLNADYQNHIYANDVIHLINKLEHVQKLYFEVYHLVRMLHEIPKKFEHEVVTHAPDLAAIRILQELKNAEVSIKKLHDKRKERQHAVNKARRPNWTGTTLSLADASKPYNVWWPIDYGWELDAYGW